MDGTLIDLRASKAAAARAATSTAGGRGGLAEKLLTFAWREGIDADDVVARFFLREGLPGGAAAQRAWDASERDARAFPGAAATLAALEARGYDLLLVTDAPRHRAEARLAGAGLARYFPGRITRENTPRGKEDTAPYALASFRMKVSPKSILMVGDHPVRDVANARAFGCRAILTTEAREWGAALCPADARIGSLPELLDHLTGAPTLAWRARVEVPAEA